VIAILGVIKPCTCSYTRTLHFWYTTVAHILTQSANLAFGPKSVCLKNNCRAWATFGLGPGSGFKMKPVYCTTLLMTTPFRIIWTGISAQLDICTGRSVTKVIGFVKLLAKVVKFQIHKLHMWWSCIILFWFWLVLIKILFTGFCWSKQNDCGYWISWNEMHANSWRYTLILINFCIKNAKRGIDLFTISPI